MRTLSNREEGVVWLHDSKAILQTTESLAASSEEVGPTPRPIVLPLDVQMPDGIPDTPAPVADPFPGAPGSSYQSSPWSSELYTNNPLPLGTGAAQPKITGREAAANRVRQLSCFSAGSSQESMVGPTKKVEDICESILDPTRSPYSSGKY